MLKALIKSRVYALSVSLVSGRGAKKGNKARSALSTALLMTVLALLIMSSLGTMLLPLAGALASGAYAWLFFTLAAIFAFVICFIGSVFMAQNQLFEAKDNELLGTMPIPPRYIIISRIVGLLIYDYIYELIVMIPAGVLFCVYGSVTLPGVLIYIAVCLFLPLPVLAISAFLGWLIALITSKMKRKNLFSYVLMIAFILAYFKLYSGFSGFIEKIQENGADIASALKTALPPFYWFGSAVATENLLHLLMFIAVCVVPFVLMCVLLSYFYVRITTATHGTVKYKYKAGKTKAHSIGKALILRELSRFFSLPIYVMNCGLGAILMPIAAVVIIFKSSSITSDPTLSGMLPTFCCLAIVFCSIMDNTTDCSISLEGSRFWILRSLPVDFSRIINAKIYMNLIISYPSIILTSLIVSIAFSFEWYYALMIIATGCIFQLFSAVFGMVANILFPKFVWQNETVAVKQTFSVFIALFGGMIALFVPVLLYSFLLSDYLSLNTFILIADAVYAALAALLWYLSLTWGKKKLLAYDN